MRSGLIKAAGAVGVALASVALLTSPAEADTLTYARVTAVSGSGGGQIKVDSQRSGSVVTDNVVADIWKASPDRVFTVSYDEVGGTWQQCSTDLFIDGWTVTTDSKGSAELTFQHSESLPSGYVKNLIVRWTAADGTVLQSDCFHIIEP